MTHPIDSHVGKRIRQQRWQLGLTQHQLADSVGVKFQQIQKYETGANRVSASRLWEIAHVLEVSPSYFFEGIDEGTVGNRKCGAGDVLQRPETAELLRTYSSMSEAQRKFVHEFARLFGQVA